MLVLYDPFAQELRLAMPWRLLVRPLVNPFLMVSTIHNRSFEELPKVWK